MSQVTISEIISSMEITDEVCIKGAESKKGFNASVASLNQLLIPVISSHPNQRGTTTLVIEENSFVKLARQRGYNI